MQEVTGDIAAHFARTKEWVLRVCGRVALTTIARALGEGGEDVVNAFVMKRVRTIVARGGLWDGEFLYVGTIAPSATLEVVARPIYADLRDERIQILLTQGYRDFKVVWYRIC